MNMDRLPTPEAFNEPPTAPIHELAAVLRMSRNGWPGNKIAEHFKYKPGLRISRELQKALDDEHDAKRIGELIHDGTAPKGYK